MDCIRYETKKAVAASSWEESRKINCLAFARKIETDIQTRLQARGAMPGMT